MVVEGSYERGSFIIQAIFGGGRWCNAGGMEKVR